MKYPIQGLGEAGWVPDQEPYELAPNAISALQNMRMRAGWAERFGGHQQVFSGTVATPNFLAPFATTSTKFVVHATAGALYANAPVGQTDITGPVLSPLLTNRWTSSVLSGVLLLNNGVQAPLYWTGDTATDAVALPGWPAGYTARALRSVKYHAVALNVTRAGVNHGHEVFWSAAAQPGSVPASWDVADATNDAGRVDVPGDGVLVDALPLGDALILYKERSMASMTYVGGSAVFNIQPLTDPVGMLAPGCGAVVPGVGHVVLTQGDVIAHAGNGSRSILDGKARQWLLDNLDTNSYAAAFVVANYAKGEVWVCIPESGRSVCTKAIVWNWQSGALSQRDLPNVTAGCSAAIDWVTNSFDADSVSFDSESVQLFADGAETFAAKDTRLLVCGTDNKIFGMDAGGQFDGADFTAYLERTGLHLDAPERVKWPNRIRPRIDAPAGTQILLYLGASDDGETAPTYGTPATFTVGTDQWVDVDAPAGRFLAWKASATGSAAWRIRALDLEYAPMGMY